MSMKNSFFNQLYPQNYIIAHPWKGALVLFLFSFLFTVLYHPLNTHEGYSLSFEITMLFYALGIAVSALGGIYLLRLVPFFNVNKPWTFGRELLAIFVLVFLMGTVVFLLAFFIEEPASTTRWNLETFLDSFLRTSFIALIPFIYFTSINLKVFFNQTNIYQESQEERDSAQRRKIDISSKLKKESLEFYEEELQFAMSDGNYVIFYLFRNGQIKKVPIRNSISNIEKQLSKSPLLLRCHRAYIVNVGQVTKRKGNSLGYRLTLSHASDEIPVSRSRIYEFDKLFKD